MIEAGSFKTIRFIINVVFRMIVCCNE